MNYAPRALSAITLLALIACSGGGGGGPQPPPAATPAPAAPTVHGNLTLSIPASTTNSVKRGTRGISPSAVSVSISVSGVSSPQIFDISSTSPNCTITSTLTLARTCTLSIGAPVGTDTVTAAIFDGPNATGNQLATGSTTIAVVSGQPFSGTVTLATAIKSVSISVGQGYLGFANSVPITVTANDLDGNPINGQFATPVTLTDNDTSGQTTLSANSVSSSTQSVSLVYKGGAISTPVTISASLSGAASGTATATFTPVSDAPLVNGSIASYSTTLTTSANVTNQPQPVATTLPAEVTTYTLSTGQTFNGMSGLVGISGTQNFPTPGSTTLATTAANVTTYLLPVVQPTTGSLAIERVGDSLSATIPIQDSLLGNSLPIQITTIPTAPYELADLLPHTAGPLTPSFAAGTETITPTISGATGGLSFAHNLDGSISITFNGAFNGIAISANIIENADGSASGTESDNNPLAFGAGGPPYKVSFSYPAPSGATIPVTYTYQTLATSLPVTTNISVPNWLNGKAPSPLASQTITDKGLVTPPSSCSAPLPGLPATLNDVETVESETHPFLGLTVTSTEDRYSASGFGTVCIVDSYSLKEYDSYKTGELVASASINSVTTLQKYTNAGIFLPSGIGAQTRVFTAQSLIRRTTALATSFPH